MGTNVKQLLLYHDLIAGIVTAMEARDSYTANHSLRVAEMTVALCEFLNLSDDETTLYHISAHLHDVGKIGIEDSILRKTARLSEDEWVQMKSHTVIGFDILHRIDCFAEISQIVRAHHERWDGHGYPDGLSGERIPFGARLIAVADSIDAMLSSRPYREAMTPENCQEEIIKNIGKMYDAHAVAAALAHWPELLLRRKRTSLIFSTEGFTNAAS